MNLLRALILTMIGVFILMTLWPLFVFFVIIFGLYWIYISSRLRRMSQTIKEEVKPNETNSVKKDVSKQNKNKAS